MSAPPSVLCKISTASLSGRSKPWANSVATDFRTGEGDISSLSQEPSAVTRVNLVLTAVFPKMQVLCDVNLCRGCVVPDVSK